MVYFTYVRSVRQDDDVYDYNITDLLTVETANGLMLYSVSGGASGGIVSYTIGVDGSLVPVMATTRAVEGVPGAGPSLLYVNDDPISEIWHAGSGHGAVWSYDIGANGALIGAQKIPGLPTDVGNVPLIAQIGPIAALASPRENSVTFYEWDGTSFSNGYQLADTDTTYLGNPSTLTTVSVGVNDFVLVGSASESGFTVVQVNDGVPRVTSAFGADLGLGMMQPTVISTVEYNGRTFVIVGSMPQNGQSGALTTFELSESGDLTMIDHRLDTRDTRFGQIQALDSIEVDGRVYVVAGGGDDGLSLFALTPDGKLLHLETIEDEVDIGLSGVTVTELVLTDSGLHLYVASEADPGVRQFFIEGATHGQTFIGTDQAANFVGGAEADWIFGGAGDELINGAAGNDLISDGGGQDQLTGGAGQDVFYLSEDNTRDEIMDFNPAEDRIDLTEWRYVNDPSELNITLDGEQVVITYRDETLIINPGTDVSLSVENVRDAIIVDGARLWEQPEIRCPWDRSDWDGVLFDTMTLDEDASSSMIFLDLPPFIALREEVKNPVNQILELSILQDEFIWQRPVEQSAADVFNARNLVTAIRHDAFLPVEQSHTWRPEYLPEPTRFSSTFESDDHFTQAVVFFSDWDMNF